MLRASGLFCGDAAEQNPARAENAVALATLCEQCVSGVRDWHAVAIASDLEQLLQKAVLKEEFLADGGTAGAGGGLVLADDDVENEGASVAVVSQHVSQKKSEKRGKSLPREISSADVLAHPDLQEFLNLMERACASNCFGEAPLAAGTLSRKLASRSQQPLRDRPSELVRALLSPDFAPDRAYGFLTLCGKIAPQSVARCAKTLLVLSSGAAPGADSAAVQPPSTSSSSATAIARSLRALGRVGSWCLRTGFRNYSELSRDDVEFCLNALKARPDLACKFLKVVRGLGSDEMCAAVLESFLQYLRKQVSSGTAAAPKGAPGAVGTVAGPGAGSVPTTGGEGAAATETSGAAEGAGELVVASAAEVKRKSHASARQLEHRVTLATKVVKFLRTTTLSTFSSEANVAGRGASSSSSSSAVPPGGPLSSSPNATDLKKNIFNHRCHNELWRDLSLEISQHSEQLGLVGMAFLAQTGEVQHVVAALEQRQSDAEDLAGSSSPAEQKKPRKRKRANEEEDPKPPPSLLRCALLTLLTSAQKTEVDLRESLALARRRTTTSARGLAGELCKDEASSSAAGGAVVAGAAAASTSSSVDAERSKKRFLSVNGLPPETEPLFQHTARLITRLMSPGTAAATGVQNVCVDDLIWFSQKVMRYSDRLNVGRLTHVTIALAIPILLAFENNEPSKQPPKNSRKGQLLSGLLVAIDFLVQSLLKSFGGNEARHTVVMRTVLDVVQDYGLIVDTTDFDQTKRGLLVIERVVSRRLKPQSPDGQTSEEDRKFFTDACEFVLSRRVRRRKEYQWMLDVWRALA